MLNLLRRRRDVGPHATVVDARSGKRIPLSIPVVVDKGVHAQDAAIVDLTMQGAKLYFDDAASVAALCIGQLLSIKPMGGCAITARLRWRDHRHCGVQFVIPMQAETMMQFESDARRWLRSRPSRARVDLRAEIVVEGQRHRGRALDISSGGVRIRYCGWLPVGTPVMVNLDGALPVAGYVRWREGEEAGVMFTRLLPLSSARHLADLCSLHPFWLQEVIEQHHTPEPWL